MSEKNVTEVGTKCSVKGCNVRASRHHNMCLAHLLEHQQSEVVRQSTRQGGSNAPKAHS